jgi:sulfatase modifying factor 1
MKTLRNFLLLMGLWMAGTISLTGCQGCGGSQERTSSLPPSPPDARADVRGVDTALKAKPDGGAVGDGGRTGPRDLEEEDADDGGGDDDDDGPQYQPGYQVLIPAGPYIRGLDLPLKEIDRRTIALRAYRIDQEEVTNAAYGECVEAGRCRKPLYDGEDDWPVVGVSWYDADTYCKFRGRRLPTDAEWEKAAFPPDEAQDGHGPMISSKYDLCTVLVIGGRDHKRCRYKEKMKQPDPITLLNDDARANYWPDRASWDGELVFDLFGNVAEWVADWRDYSWEYFEPKVLVDPQGPPTGPDKVIRGGSFAAYAGSDESEYRTAPPDKRFRDVGFRCASDVK